MVVVLEHTTAAQAAIGTALSALTGMPTPPLPEPRVYAALAESIDADPRECEHYREVDSPEIAQSMVQAIIDMKPGDTDDRDAAVEAGLDAARAYLSDLLDDGIIEAHEALDIMEDTREDAYAFMERPGLL